MRNNFVAIDFETSSGHIPCSIGIVEFVNGIKVSEYYSLIKPIDLKFNPINSSINKIFLEDIINEREFNQVWNDISHYFINRNIVAHNASTDISVLNKTLEYYGIEKPHYKSYCTLKVCRNLLQLENHKLSTVANKLKIKQLNYHNALDDANVCAQVLINLYAYSKDDNQIESYGKYLFYPDLEENLVSKNYFMKGTVSKTEITYSVNLDACKKVILDKIFVVSGVFENFSREGIKKAIEDNGGKVGSAISAKTDFVIAGNNMGPAKLEKATKLNVAIISESDFIEMLD